VAGRRDRQAKHRRFPVRAPDPLPPVELRRTVEQWFGEAGRIWCDMLPERVAGLLHMWRLSPGVALSGGSHSLVLECVRADGSPAVLKLPFPDDENRTEADALRLYDGDGAVRLFDHDPATGALLLERLSPGTPLLDLADRRQALDIACGILRRLRRPAPVGHRFPGLRDLAADWASTIPAEQERLGRPLPDRVADEAARLARDLAMWVGPDLVVNRDAHLGNFLSAGRAPWLLIDPKPVLGEAAFDGAHLLLANLDADAACAEALGMVERIADRLAVDPRRVRGWALVRAVDSALWASGLGDAGKAAARLARARLLLEPA
jgi:streptomycin 6-kinase